MSCQIRNMVIEDKEEVLKMMKIFYESPAILSNGSLEIFINDFENCINDNPYLEGYIFENKGKVLGYTMVAKSFSTEFGKPCLWIEDIYIKEEYRGMGLGSLFFEYIENKYPNTIIRLEAEKDNKRAISFYQKKGYEILPYLELKKNN